jgi:hypothetical protein
VDKNVPARIRHFAARAAQAQKSALAGATMEPQVCGFRIAMDARFRQKSATSAIFVP